MGYPLLVPFQHSVFLFRWVPGRCSETLRRLECKQAVWIQVCLLLFKAAQPNDF